MISILHTADIHLRTSQYARSSRGDDFLRAFEAVIDTAISRKIGTILVAGDLLDSTRPSPKIVNFLKTMNSKASNAGILVLVTSGNHDLTRPHWASVVGVDGSVATDPQGIKIIDDQLVTLPSGLTVYGQPFVHRDEFIAIKDTLPAADILMFHGMIGELTHFKHEAAIPIGELPSSKYRLIALGDIHRRKYVTMPDGCLIGYPGSTELCESSEPDEKTVTLIHFDENNKKATPTHEFIAIPTRTVLRYKLNTEDEVESALIQAELRKSEDPVVIFEYNVSLTNVPQRFAARLDPTRVVLRPYPMSRDPKMMNQGMDTRERLKLENFLEKFIAPGTSTYQLASSLLKPDAGPARVHELVDAFIETRRKEIEAVTQIT